MLGPEEDINAAFLSLTFPLASPVVVKDRLHWTLLLQRKPVSVGDH